MRVCLLIFLIIPLSFCQTETKRVTQDGLHQLDSTLAILKGYEELDKYLVEIGNWENEPRFIVSSETIFFNPLTCEEEIISCKGEEIYLEMKERFLQLTKKIKDVQRKNKVSLDSALCFFIKKDRDRYLLNQKIAEEKVDFIVFFSSLQNQMIRAEIYPYSQNYGWGNHLLYSQSFEGFLMALICLNDDGSSWIRLAVAQV